MGRALAVAVITLAAAGGGCDPSTYHDFRAQLAQRTCDRAVACGVVGESERARCPQPAAVLSLAMRDDFDVQAGLDAGQLRYHPEGASTCLDAVARATCDELQSAPRIASGCDDVVRPNTVVGNRCWGAAQCEGGQCVGEAGGCPGTCVAYPPPGSVCDVAAGPPERTCDPTVQYCGWEPGAPRDQSTTCIRLRLRGQSCDDDVQCAKGWACVKGKCDDPPHHGEGAPCDDTTPCDDDLYCAAGACARPLDAGFACDRPTACRRGLACLGLGAGGDPAAPGSCQPWRDVGGPCDPTALVTGCPASQRCNSDGAGGGSCAALDATPVAAWGQACSPALACAAGLVCGVAGLCVDPGGRGGTCATTGATSSCATGLVCDARSVCSPPSAITCQ